MEWLESISRWLTGGAHPYHKLTQCMMGDTFWIALTVTLDIAVALGYVLIVLHWWRNQRLLPPSPARTALATMRNIFIFCAICGYAFIPIKMFWPAWRLYDMFLAGLVFYTWRYALRSRDLRVIYGAIGRSNQLAADLAESLEQSKQKSFFLNAVSHDLRTPLNSLILQANLAELCAEGGDVAGTKAAIDEIKNGVRLSAALLERLLEYARLESAEDQIRPADFDLDQLLRDVLNTHAALAARKSLQLTGNTNTGVSVRTDRLKLERILNNLISNAIKFTSRGSVKVQVERTRDSIQIHVIDTGIGITPECCQQLFREFYQVQNHERDRNKGFGLGLAISRRMGHQLGGDILVDSAAGHGSRFTVVLPLKLTDAAAAAESRERRVEPSGIRAESAGAAGGG